MMIEIFLWLLAAVSIALFVIFIWKTINDMRNKEKSDWISIKNKLPGFYGLSFENLSDDVLLLHKDGQIHVGYFQLLADERGLVINLSTGICPYNHPHWPSMTKEDFTHWMPLPPKAQ